MGTAAELSAEIAEIEGGPEGPAVGAFFDFDRTLISGFSAGAVTREQLRSGALGAPAMARSLRAALRMGLGRGDFSDMIQIGAESWSGRSEAELEELGERLLAGRLAARLYPEARALVEAHQRKRHTVALASSAMSYQVEPMARDLGVDHVLCTRLEVENGVCTGRQAGPSMWGRGKADAVAAFASEHRIDLARSFAYTDGKEDVALLELVGNPRPTNPDRGLARVADERGWTVRHFTSRRRPGLADVARNALALGSLVPVGYVATAVGVLSGSRREAIELTTSAWPELALALAGVDVSVTGEAHLWSHRPAVFVYHHRNPVDAVAVAKLLHRRYAVLVSEELRAMLAPGVLGRIAEGVLLRPGDGAAEAIAERLRKGISVAAAEATGGDAAFRAAVVAGVPVVPVVIRNTYDVQGANRNLVRPGTLEVVVQPPVPVGEWDAGEIGRRADEVRRVLADGVASRRS